MEPKNGAAKPHVHREVEQEVARTDGSVPCLIAPREDRLHYPIIPVSDPAEHFGDFIKVGRELRTGIDGSQRLVLPVIVMVVNMRS
jgi:hypothetical protein